MIKNKNENPCDHDFLPIGMDTISSDHRKIEVIAAINCRKCGLFRTKILYFDRQRDLKKNA